MRHVDILNTETHDTYETCGYSLHPNPLKSLGCQTDSEDQLDSGPYHPIGQVEFVRLRPSQEV
jgi:hypothetical protein